MKNFLLAGIFILALAACGDKSSEKATYQCPMKCEAEKTYDKAGQCPVCKMDLEPVK